MKAVARLVHPDDLPVQLFACDTRCLRFSSGLAAGYRHVLNAHGLLEAAASAVHESDIGGAAAYQAERHFMTAYSGSCARIELAILDPHGTLVEASNAFISAFAGGKVGLLDIPCGGGAASASLLCTVAELRAQRIVPALPLAVQLVGGDISEAARGYAVEIFSAVDPYLRANGISVTVDFQPWDVRDAHSTSAVVHRWLGHTRQCREHFVLTANCSGFLQDGGHFKEAHSQLNEIFRYAILQRSTIAWIEPQTKGAMASHWPRFRQRFLPTFSRWFGFPTDVSCAESSFFHPLRENRVHDVRVSLIKLESKRP
jgi:hypothetical protein